MVVMITPVAFSSISYKTYVIFAVIKAAMFPAVYFFYPETAYRSLEEMDSTFRKTTNVFDVVKMAKNEPRRYGKHGELLINLTTKIRKKIAAALALFPPLRLQQTALRTCIIQIQRTGCRMGTARRNSEYRALIIKDNRLVYGHISSQHQIVPCISKGTGTLELLRYPT